ncbi:MAG TPA: hypothetical protein VIS99_05915, partial [Terrimicrobiaceae bacterium]
MSCSSLALEPHGTPTRWSDPNCDGGCGLAQRWEGPIEQIRSGDVVWLPPAEKHWQGATATTAMTHIAIVEQLDGKTADWMEQVS